MINTKMIIFLDTEYTDKEYLSIQYKVKVQISGQENSIIFQQVILDLNYKSFIEKDPGYLKFQQDNPFVKIEFRKLTGNDLDCILLKSIMDNLYHYYPALFINNPDLDFTIYIFFFFSVTDLYISLGKETILDLIVKRKIVQKNNINGFFKLKDYFSETKNNLTFNICLKDM